MSNLPLFPTSLVGSLPRPRWLIQVLRDREAGIIPDIEWQMLAEHAARDAVHDQNESGLDIVTDGEHRRDGFLSFVVERWYGVRRMPLAERLRTIGEEPELEARLQRLDVPLTAIKSPVVTDKLRVLHPVRGTVQDEADYLRQISTKPVRIALPGPYTLSRTLWSSELSPRAYSSMKLLAAEIVAILRDEIAQLRDRGVAFIQLDEPALAALAAVENCATFSGTLLPAIESPDSELWSAVALINATLSDAAGVRTVLHVSQRNWTRQPQMGSDMDITMLMPYLEAMCVDQLSLGAASRDLAQAESLGQLSHEKEIGLGAISARDDVVESAETIAMRVRAFLPHIPAERIVLTPDSGFAAYAERNLNTLETAKAKLTELSKAAAILRNEVSGGV